MVQPDKGIIQSKVVSKIGGAKIYKITTNVTKMFKLLQIKLSKSGLHTCTCDSLFYLKNKASNINFDSRKLN